MIGSLSSHAERAELLLEGYLKREMEPPRHSPLLSAAAARDRKRSAAGFERDYPAMLLALASSVRTGLDPLVALLELRELFPEGSEMREELSRLKVAIDSGADEDAVIRTFGAGLGLPDCGLFSTAFVLARRQGASLAECLQRLARVTRQRQSFRRRIRSAIAMQRLSCIGIALSAVAIAVVQALSNLEALRTALADPAGSRLIAAGLGLIVTGGVWISRIAKTRI